MTRSASSAANSAPVVGLIGLGNMGASMALNLVKTASNPADVLVFDVVAANMQKLADAGATTCPDVGTLAKKCDVIITMVPATAHVTGILKGNGSSDGNSVFEGAKKGSLLIDCR